MHLDVQSSKPPIGKPVLLWKLLVDGVSFCGTNMPAACPSQTLGAATWQYRCELCVGEQPSFKTRKALESHMRIKHPRITDLDRFVDDSGICPVCNQNFYTRLRVLHHVREKRVRARSKRLLCRDALLSGAFPMICADKLVQVRKHDNDQLRERRRVGKSKVPVGLHVKRKLAPPLVPATPRKRLRAKLCAADVPEKFWWMASETPRCLFSLGPGLQRDISPELFGKRRKLV